jgi:hypothetical protein
MASFGTLPPDAWLHHAGLWIESISQRLRRQQSARFALPKKQTAKAAHTSKKDAVMALLRRADGATAPEIVEATGWQRHSVRGFLSILGKTVKIARDAEGRYRVD